MTKTKRINELAKLTKQDTTALKAEGISLHEENYTTNMWYLSMEFDAIIRKLDDRHGAYFNKTSYQNGSTAFERRLRKRLMECTLTYDGVRDFEALVRRTFERTTREFYKRRTSYAKDEKSYDELTSFGAGGSLDGDVKAVHQFSTDDDIELEFEHSEIVRALFDRFGTDEKRRYVMERFIDEKNLSISNLAREIAKEEKGTAFNSARTFITRFIKDMRSFIEDYENVAA